MGIIHHSNYVKWMEEARVAYMDHLDYSFAKVEENGIGSPVVGLSVEYKSPVRFNDIVEIRLSITRYSGIVMEVSYEIFNTTTGLLSATAKSKHCYINAAGKVVNLKKTLPELDSRFAAEVVRQA